MALSDHTIAAAIESTRRALLGQASNPGLEARVLAGSALGLDASALIAYGENIIDDARRRRLAELTARRKRGEPIAYIVGFKDFCGLRILVNRDVLIPRPETEELVGLTLREAGARTREILDLGTGSGAIACALANALPEIRVLATDASAAALRVAAENAANLALDDRIEFAEGDLFDPVGDRRFDVIAANLPYVGERDDALLDASVRDFEPALAFMGGPDGLDVYRRMLPAAPAHIKPGGSLYMECGPENAVALAALARTAFPHAIVDIVDDLGGRARIVAVRCS